MKKCSSRHTRSGFTLIELLTVIAIIGILAAIIIPVVGKVRSTARSATCVSNLRQISVAIQLYANDNKDLLPGPVSMGQSPFYYYSGTDASASKNLAALLRDYLAPARAVPERGANRWMQDIFVCPGWASSGGLETPSATSPNSTSYILNNTPWPYGVQGGNSNIKPFGYGSTHEPLRLFQIQNFPLSRTWMLVDGDNLLLTEALGSSADNNNYINRPAHGSSRNILYYDGHVQKVPHAQFQRYP